jgi:hypothetical protein
MILSLYGSLFVIGSYHWDALQDGTLGGMVMQCKVRQSGGIVVIYNETLHQKWGMVQTKASFVINLHGCFVANAEAEWSRVGLVPISRWLRKHAPKGNVHGQEIELDRCGGMFALHILNLFEQVVESFRVRSVQVHGGGGQVRFDMLQRPMQLLRPPPQFRDWFHV